MSEVGVARAAPRAMITLRGDLGDGDLQGVCTGLAGVAFPAAGRAEFGGARGLVWMSPDELLILLPLEDRERALAEIDSRLAGRHHLAADMSDARTLFTVSGVGLRDMLGKLTPVDLSPGAFGPGRVRRTRLAQVAAGFWMRDADTVEVICFRSVAEYTELLLRTAAEAGPVHFHARP